MLFQAGSCKTLQVYRLFLFIFSLLFIRSKLCCFISSLAATLRFQNSFTFQSFAISKESSITSAFLANQGEIFQFLKWFLSSLGYPNGQSLHLLPFEQISLQYRWPELCAIFRMKAFTTSLVTCITTGTTLSFRSQQCVGFFMITPN